MVVACQALIHKTMHLHLVSFNIPYPPNYGGVIDVFFKVKALQLAGVKVHLHCFDYGREKSEELSKLCADVHYYPRRLSILKQLKKIPFIVATRSNQELIDNLNRDEHPILLEGLHCTYPLLKNLQESRKIIVRAHNIEHEYYQGLARTEKNILKKAYFKVEALKLKTYEPILRKASAIASISQSDKDYFSAINPNTELVLPFHPFNEVAVKPGKGKYILIHGDLSVPENIQSTLWLIENVISRCPHPFVIAGKNPPECIRTSASKNRNVKLIPNPNDTTLTELIENAQLNIVHSIFPQGFKLKLLHVLYRGRWCICNHNVIKNTGLEPLCIIANSSNEYTSVINELMEKAFEVGPIEERVKVLKQFSNQIQANKLIGMFNDPT